MKSGSKANYFICVQIQAPAPVLKRWNGRRRAMSAKAEATKSVRKQGRRRHAGGLAKTGRVILAPIPFSVAYQAGRGRDGEAIPASSTARMPVRKMPSKVPAPPIEATGAPRPLILSRLRRSAPTSVPIEPPI